MSGDVLPLPPSRELIRYRYKKVGQPVADAIDEDAPPKPLASPYWQLKLFFVTLLGIAAISGLIWLMVVHGLPDLQKAILDANKDMTKEQYKNLFWYILGGEMAVLAVFGAAYKKLHHSSAKLYALLADNPLCKPLGFRTHAGRWGMLSRSIRTVAAIAYISLITIAVMSGDIAAGIDAVMKPYQAIMGLTWLGIIPGIVANNAKIEQFYTAENFLLNSVNRALTQLQEKNDWTEQELKDWEKQHLLVGRKIPHGMRALCNARRQDLFTALFIRKVHDFNSIVGSLLSVTRVIAMIMVASSFSIPPVFLAIVVGSSILSSFVAWITNRSRLQANKNMLLDIQHDYLEIQKQSAGQEKFDEIEALADRIFTGLSKKPTNPFIHKAIRFHLKKALLEYYVTPENPEGNNERLITEITLLLEEIIAPENNPPSFLTRFVNRDRHNTRAGLARIYDSFTKTDGTNSITASSVEALSVLETKIAMIVMNTRNSQQQTQAMKDKQADASPSSPAASSPSTAQQSTTSRSTTNDSYQMICNLILKYDHSKKLAEPDVTGKSSKPAQVNPTKNAKKTESVDTIPNQAKKTRRASVSDPSLNIRRKRTTKKIRSTSIFNPSLNTRRTSTPDPTKKIRHVAIAGNPGKVSKPNKIDPRHLHRIAFGLVSACHQEQKNPEFKPEQQKQVFGKAVEYLVTQGFLTPKGLNESKVIKEHPSAVIDPHGRTSLEDSLGACAAAAVTQAVAA
jgi:hypothetical protein